MDRDQLLQLRSGVEAQLSWALQHDGDEELVDILRSENARLSEIIAAQRDLQATSKFEASAAQLHEKRGRQSGDPVKMMTTL
jgi:hypothetical protein